jgi:hypothetical protein
VGGWGHGWRQREEGQGGWKVHGTDVESSNVAETSHTGSQGPGSEILGYTEMKLSGLRLVRSPKHSTPKYISLAYLKMAILKSCRQLGLCEKKCLAICIHKMYPFASASIMKYLRLGGL